MKKTIVFLLVLIMVCAVTMTGCKDKDTIVLRMGDPHPDRGGGVGLVLDRINAEFKELHPKVVFEIESLNDQPYQEKIRIYSVANDLPDVFKWWTFPSRVGPLAEAGMLQSLNKEVFANFGYLPGALETCEFNGTLYSIPASADFWVIYVNKALFERAGVALPVSWEDIVASVPRFRAQGITPMVTNGLDGWPLCIMFDSIVQRINGDFSRSYDAVARRNGVRYTDPDFVQAAAYMQNIVRAGIFGIDLLTSDYGAAQNMFIQERAAMYMMGAWEMGMATNPGFSQSFRDNLDVIKVPVIRDGQGTSDDAMFWFGGNFVASAKSKNNKLAVEYLEFLAERFSLYCWEAGAGFPAQVITPLDTDSDVAKKLLQFSSEIKSMSGFPPALDYGNTIAFNGEFNELIRQLCANRITPQVFAQRLDAAAEADFNAR